MLTNNILISKIEIPEAAIESAEVFLDEYLTQSGIIKEIPILKWIVSSKNFKDTVSDRILLTKVLTFLNAQNVKYDHDFFKMVQEMNSNPKFNQKVGRQIVLIIEKMNDYTKISILSKLFKYYLNTQLSFDDFIEIYNAVDILLVSDIENYFLTIERINEKDTNVLNRFYRAGLINVNHKLIQNETQNSVDTLNIKSKYELNRIGLLFKQLLLTF